MIDPSLAIIDTFRDLPRPMREAFYASCIPGEQAAARFDWQLSGRPDQMPPPAHEDFSILVFRGPRGSGKTEAADHVFADELWHGRATEGEGAAIVVGTGKNDPGTLAKRIQQALPKERRPTWEPSKGPAGLLTFPRADGSVQEVPIFTASAPEGIVMNNFALVLCDDIAKWGAHAELCWNHIRACVRVGYARIIVATTKRGTRLLRELLSGDMRGVVIRRPVDANGNPRPRANWRNLHPRYFTQTAADAKGSRFGHEEYDDEDIVMGSPFSPPVDFDAEPTKLAVVRRDDFEEVAVAVDESGGKGGDHDEWGIVAGGRRQDQHVVALEDASGGYDDAEAGEVILATCERWGATKIVVETNRGDRVLTVINAAWHRRRAEGKQGKLRALPEIVKVVAKDNKRLRAGELRPLYLAGLLHHGPGCAPLERQQREWDPDAPKRPRVDDRIDAWVHLVHYLARLAERGDAWAAAPEADPKPAGDEPYRYQPPAPAPAGDGWSAASPYAYGPTGPDPLRY